MKHCLLELNEAFYNWIHVGSVSGSQLKIMHSYLKDTLHTLKALEERGMLMSQLRLKITDLEDMMDRRNIKYKSYYDEIKSS